MREANITKWRIFLIDKPEPHLQLSFATNEGLLVKNLYLKHPNRTKTIQFLKTINGHGSFRSLADLKEIIEQANFRPVSVDWRYSKQGEKEIVRINQVRF